MKALKHLSLILCLATVSLSSGAAQAPVTQAKGNNILCELLGIGCVSTTKKDSGGTGKEPPRKKGG